MNTTTDPTELPATICSPLRAMLDARATELERAAACLRGINVAELLACVEDAQKAIEALEARMPLQPEARQLPFKVLWMDKLGDTKAWVHQMYETLRNLKKANAEPQATPGEATHL